MPSDKKLAEVGPWAKEKLDALNSYLDFYTKVFKNKKFYRTIYFDGFAGGGQAIVRRSSDKSINTASLFSENNEKEEIEFIDGSPKIALDLANPFSTYVFVDTNPNRLKELQEHAEQYKESRKIIYREEECDDAIKWMLNQNIQFKTHRGVAFLDPFGAHLPWEAVQSLGKTKLFEVIINLPLDMAINRLLKKDNEIPSSWLEQLNNVFGPYDWHSEVYEKKKSLFEDTDISKRSDTVKRLLKLYLSMLRTEFKCVANPKLIRNSKGHPLYYIIWAGQHRKGLEGAEYILGMSKRLPTGPKGGKPLSS